MMYLPLDTVRPFPFPLHGLLRVSLVVLSWKTLSSALNITLRIMDMLHGDNSLKMYFPILWVFSLY